MKSLRVFLFISFFALIAQAQVQTIVFDEFTPSRLADFQLNGATAGLNPTSFGALALTRGYNEGGSAFLRNSISLQGDDGFRASFSTKFAWRITESAGVGDSDGAGADGFTFTINSISNNAGGYGIGLGYAGVLRSFAIEFDTYQNAGVDGGNGNHVGVDINGDVNSVARVNIPTNAGRLNDGTVRYTWVDYNGETQLLEVRLADTDVRPEAAIIAYTVDLVAVLQTPNVFVGFTSGTGSGKGWHQILSWVFTNTYRPVFTSCATDISGTSTSSATMGDLDVWGWEAQPQYRAVVNIQVAETELSNWRLEVHFPANGEQIVRYGTWYSVYTDGVFTCETATPSTAVISPAAWAMTVSQGGLITVEYVASNNARLTADEIRASTSYVVYYSS
jgi:hypothetical protein